LSHFCTSCIETLTIKKDHSSPVEAPPANLPAAPVSLSRDMSREIYTTSRESRSNSSASQTSHTNAIDKWEVFRDEEVATGSSIANRAQQSRVSVVSIHPTTPKLHDDDFGHLAKDEKDHRPSHTTTLSHLTQTLRAIAITRTTLLHQLQDLQKQEDEILTLLTQASSTIPTPQPEPLNARSLQTLRAQPSKMSREKPHTRTVSAPEIVTPKNARQSTRGRVVLGNKTPVIEDKTPDIETPHFPATRVYAVKVVSRRVPIHFGDEDEELDGMARSTSTGGGGGARSRSNSRGRGMGNTRGASSRGRNKSRSASCAPDAPILGENSYAVPETVARKRWDF
jgi:hypothetical protein